MTNLRNWLITCGGACFTDTPPRRCFSCALARYPLASGLATGFPRCSTGSPPLCLPSCGIVHILKIDTCPLSKDAATNRSLHLVPWSALRATVPFHPRHVTACTNSVPFPCESSQHSHSKTSTSVAFTHPLSFDVRARMNASKLSATRHFRCGSAFPANASNMSATRSCSLLSTILTGASAVRGTGGALLSGCLHDLTAARL